MEIFSQLPRSAYGWQELDGNPSSQGRKQSQAR